MYYHLPLAYHEKEFINFNDLRDLLRWIDFDDLKSDYTRARTRKEIFLTIGDVPPRKCTNEPKENFTREAIFFINSFNETHYCRSNNQF